MTLKSVTRNKTGNGPEAFERARIFVGSLQLAPDGPPPRHHELLHPEYFV